MLRFKGKLGSAVPAPRRGGKANTVVKKSIIGVAIIRNCLDGKPTPLKELQAATGDESTNAIGTMVGAGVGGGKGANLHRDKQGDILPCRENVINLIEADFPTQSDLDALLAERGQDDEAFFAAVEALPSHVAM